MKAPETSMQNPLFTNGYVPKTNFWECFCEIEKSLKSNTDDFVIINIGNNCKRMVEMCNGKKKQSYIFLTELYMVLNAKLWEWYEKEGKKSKIGLYYNDLWIACREMIESVFTKKQMEYFYRTTD